MVSLVLAIFGLTASFPGVFLLNQSWQIVPTTTRVGGFTLNGSPLSDRQVLWFSLSIAGFLLTKSILFAVLSYVPSGAKPRTPR